jgi:hypothetical protein
VPVNKSRQEQGQEERHPEPWHVFKGIAFGVIAAWSAWLLVALYIGRKDTLNLENAGKLGDFFGAFTSLLSALTFAGVFVGIWMERQQVLEERTARHRAERQRDEEMREQREARAITDARQAEQLRAMQEQLQTMIALFRSIDEQRKEERRQFEDSVQPVFSFERAGLLRDAQSGNWLSSWKVRNEGGAIASFAIEGGGRVYAEGDVGIIEAEKILLIRINPRPTPKERVEFAFGYLTLVGKLKRKQRFYLVGEEGYPRPVVEEDVSPALVPPQSPGGAFT